MEYPFTSITPRSVKHPFTSEIMRLLKDCVWISAGGKTAITDFKQDHFGEMFADPSQVMH